MLAQFGISSLQTSQLDELLFFAAGYLAANDPTKLDLYRKEDKLIYSMSAGDATGVLIDFFNISKTRNTPELPDGGIRGIISGTVSCGAKMYHATSKFDLVFGINWGQNGVNRFSALLQNAHKS